MEWEWLHRVGRFLAGEAPDTPVLIVATPLLRNETPVVPLTIVAQSRDVTSVLEKIAETRHGKLVEGKGKTRSVKAKRKRGGKGKQ